MTRSLVSGENAKTLPMCVKLENSGRIIIPGTSAPVKAAGKIIQMKWGVDLGHGLVLNARIESIMGNIWEKWGLTLIGELEVDTFFETTTDKTYRFKLPSPTNIGVLHNTEYFVVITEPASEPVKKYHARQPCYQMLHKLLVA